MRRHETRSDRGRAAYQSSMSTRTDTQIAELALLDWKRQVFDGYQSVRQADDPATAWREWRALRDRLCAEHPQSPFEHDGRGFAGLPFFDYDPAFRVEGQAEPAPSEPRELESSTGDPIRFRQFATVAFALAGEPLRLPLYWLEGYGGGMFLPFSDATSGRETYGGGRYLLDTVKGADLGERERRLVLDFNFAYNPSCAYDPRWTCPLPAPASRLAVRVTAGERTLPA
jgi:uncharacterized protein (DUF1684 family)